MDVPDAEMYPVTRMQNTDKIQRLALSFLDAGWSLRRNWKLDLKSMESLKTLTLMMSGRGNTWVREKEIELRDLEERKRSNVIMTSFTIDVIIEITVCGMTIVSPEPFYQPEDAIPLYIF